MTKKKTPYIKVNLTSKYNIKVRFHKHEEKVFSCQALCERKKRMKPQLRASLVVQPKPTSSIGGYQILTTRND